MNVALIQSIIIALAFIIFYFKYPRHVERKLDEASSLYAKGSKDAKNGIQPKSTNKTYMEGYSEAVKVAEFYKKDAVK